MTQSDSHDESIKLYDLQLIDQMCRGNEAQILKLVEVFVEEISKTLKEIELAFSNKDLKEIKKLTHKIKPTLTYFGTEKLEKEIVLIEEQLLTEIPSQELELKITTLNSDALAVLSQLKKDFNIA